MPARHVNDAQAARTEKDIGVGITALIVRAAMSQERQLRPKVRIYAGSEEAEDAAHVVRSPRLQVWRLNC